MCNYTARMSLPDGWYGGERKLFTHIFLLWESEGAPTGAGMNGSVLHNIQLSFGFFILGLFFFFFFCPKATQLKKSTTLTLCRGCCSPHPPSGFPWMLLSDSPWKKKTFGYLCLACRCRPCTRYFTPSPFLSLEISTSLLHKSEWLHHLKKKKKKDKQPKTLSLMSLLKTPVSLGLLHQLRITSLKPPSPFSFLLDVVASLKKGPLIRRRPSTDNKQIK